MRLGRWQTWVTLAAALGVVLALTNMILFERNRTLQGEIGSRAQYIQQTVQLEGLHREIVNAIANLAVRNRDDALKTVLSEHGITINIGQPQAGPSSLPGATAPAPETKGRR